MATITNTACKLFNLPKIDPTPELCARAKLTKGEIESLAGVNGMGEQVAMSSWGPVTIGMSMPADLKETPHTPPRHPDTVEISDGHLKLLRFLYRASFTSQCDMGLRVG